MRGLRDKACTKAECDNFGKRGINIGGHGWFLTKSGRKRRYRCKVCGGTVSTNTGTAYSGLRCARSDFDQVASMRVEGVSISATARITGRSRNTIARWLERASAAAKLFNQRVVRDFEMVELQADELFTFIGGKSNPIWLFATLEVWSRLWPSSVVGRRSYRNTKALLGDVVSQGRWVGCPLITSDGFEFYFAVVRRLFGPACVYGQVIKTRRKNRVIRVERRIRIGTKSRLKDALLLRCHYNFVRRHSGLKFGRECRTPAMQAGLATWPLSFRDIFTARGVSARPVVAVVYVVPADLFAATMATGSQTVGWTPDQLAVAA